MKKEIITVMIKNSLFFIIYKGSIKLKIGELRANSPSEIIIKSAIQRVLNQALL